MGVAACRACDITVTVSNMGTGCFFSFRRSGTATGHNSHRLFGMKVKLMLCNAGRRAAVDLMVVFPLP